MCGAIPLLLHMPSLRAGRRVFALPLLDDVKIFHQFLTDAGMIVTLRNE